ncbi:MAG: hypothetical protein JRE81_02735 [Deltaproteobacteria bacterium]|nr:hypothetical protein [Deltaproteobacteria bacterium]
MRSLALWILPILMLGSVSLGRAQDANDDETAQVAEPREPAAKQQREPFVKRDGQVADNEQLGGEPTLTESPEAPADAGADVQSAEECDLDCIEAELAREKEQERRRKGTLEVARETGSVSAEAAETEAGDTLAAEPSTTTLDEAKLDVPDDRRLPTRLGPVRIEVGKADDWIGIGFATQMEFEHDQQFATGGFSENNQETLEFRRIRFTLSSSFIEGRIQSRFQINLTPSAFELIDLWFSFTRFKFATFRIGQFKIPYDRYRAQSFAALSFVDWAPTTRMFGSERQVGGEMLASGGFLDLEYSIGIFSGVNARASHAVGITEVYGEVPRSPSDLGFGEVVSSFHPEIAARVARNFGEINTDSNTDVLRTTRLRHSVGMGVAWDARPVAVQDLGLRLSAEWLGKIRGVHMNVISYLAWYKPWEGGKILFGPLGFMAETGYRFNLMWELALRYSMTYLTPWLRSDARSYGQAQIADAADPAQAMLQYERNGDRTTNQDLALAGTSHIIGNSLKVVAETAWQQQLWNTGRANGLRINVQLQLLF